jgi:hypothetical protein
MWRGRAAVGPTRFVARARVDGRVVLSSCPDLHDLLWDVVSARRHLHLPSELKAAQRDTGS